MIQCCPIELQLYTVPSPPALVHMAENILSVRLWGRGCAKHQAIGRLQRPHHELLFHLILWIYRPCCSVGCDIFSFFIKNYYCHPDVQEEDFSLQILHFHILEKRYDFNYHLSRLSYPFSLNYQGSSMDLPPVNLLFNFHSSLSVLSVSKSLFPFHGNQHSRDLYTVISVINVES